MRIKVEVPDSEGLAIDIPAVGGVRCGGLLEGTEEHYAIPRKRRAAGVVVPRHRRARPGARVVRRRRTRGTSSGKHRPAIGRIDQRQCAEPRRSDDAVGARPGLAVCARMALRPRR